MLIISNPTSYTVCSTLQATYVQSHQHPQCLEKARVLCGSLTFAVHIMTDIWINVMLCRKISTPVNTMRMQLLFAKVGYVLYPNLHVYVDKVHFHSVQYRAVFASHIHMQQHSKSNK